MQFMAVDILVVSIAIAVGSFEAPTPPMVRTSPSSETRGLGSCSSNGRPVDLRRVMFLENRQLDFDGSDGPMRITLLGQTVNIETLAPDREQTVYTGNIGSMVNRGEDDADVELKLALLEGRPILYWRETFQHRIYRQGFFNIVGRELTRLCERRG